MREDYDIGFWRFTVLLLDLLEFSGYMMGLPLAASGAKREFIGV